MDSQHYIKHIATNIVSNTNLDLDTLERGLHNIFFIDGEVSRTNKITNYETMQPLEYGFKEVRATTLNNIYEIIINNSLDFDTKVDLVSKAINNAVSYMEGQKNGHMDTVCGEIVTL